MENVRLVLEAAGSDLAHVVQTRNYVRDAANLPLYNQLYREYFPPPYPSLMLILLTLKLNSTKNVKHLSRESKLEL